MGDQYIQEQEIMHEGGYLSFCLTIWDLNSPQQEILKNMALEPTWTVSRGEKSLATSGPGRSRPKRSGGQEKTPKTGPQHCAPSAHPGPVRTLMMTPLSRPHPSLCQLHGWHFLQNHDILDGEESFMGCSPTDLHGNWGPLGEKNDLPKVTEPPGKKISWPLIHNLDDGSVYVAPGVSSPRALPRIHPTWGAPTGGPFIFF